MALYHQPTAAKFTKKLLNIGGRTKTEQKYKNIVKAQSPAILRSKKRGKRTGARQRARNSQSNGRIKTALPSIFLSNVNQLHHNIDELAFQSHQLKN